jgi:Flp pilus assembly pilin Flp
MRNLFAQLINDEAGFIVSAELVLVATIGVLAMIVGLTEVAFNVNQELEDVGSAIGNINQSFSYNGTSGTKGMVAGSKYADQRDAGDCDCDIVCNVAPRGEDTSWQN